MAAGLVGAGVARADLMTSPDGKSIKLDEKPDG